MKKFLFSFLISLLTLNLSASHFIGGEITWECDTDPLSPTYGQYTFYMHIYQDCDGISFYYGNGAESITVHNHPTLSQISLNFLDTNDISSVKWINLNDIKNFVEINNSNRSLRELNKRMQTLSNKIKKKHILAS